MPKLNPYKNRKESLLPIMDVYLNTLQEIWVYNVDMSFNKNSDEWIQTRVTCPKCGWRGIERIIGAGQQPHLVEIDNQKMVEEFYFCRCPYCHNAWTLDATRPYNPKTLALDAGDDLNEGITELDEELKESRDNK